MAATDLSTFNPPNVQALLTEFESQGAAVAGQWWKTNSQTVQGYLQSIAQATVDTASALATGKITADTAATLMQMHTDTLKGTLTFALYMAEALAQKLLDGLTAAIGWAIFNKTGINIMPDVVKPAGTPSV